MFKSEILNSLLHSRKKIGRVNLETSNKKLIHRDRLDITMNCTLSKPAEALRLGRSETLVVKKFFEKRILEIKPLIEFLKKMSDQSVLINSNDIVPETATPQSVSVRFVRLGFGLDHTKLSKKDTVILEQVNGITLSNDKFTKNTKIPDLIHYSVIMGWLRMMQELEKQGIIVDQNIDSDIIIKQKDGDYIATMIDPRPLYKDQIYKSSIEFEKYTVYKATILSFLDTLSRIYGSKESQDGRNYFGNDYFFVELLETITNSQDFWTWKDIEELIFDNFNIKE